MKLDTNSIYEGIFYLNSEGVDFEVAHLYEHTLVTSSLEHLAREGHPRRLSGWVSGETFNGAILIDYGLYDKRAVSELQKYLSTPNRVDTSNYETHLPEMLAEGQLTLESINEELLLAQLKELNGRPVAPEAQIEKRYIPGYSGNSAGSPLKVLRRPKQYQRLVLTISFSNDDRIALNTFARLRPLLLNSTSDYVCSVGAGIQANSSIVHLSEVAVGAASLIDIKKELYDKDRLVEGMRDSIKELGQTITSHPEKLDRYLAAYANSPQWNNTINDALRTTNLIISRQELIDSITSKHVDEVLNNLNINVFKYRKEYDQYFD